MGTDDKKPGDDRGQGTPETLEADDLDEVHGGSSISGVSSRHLKRPASINVNQNFDTAYGGEGFDGLGPTSIGANVNPLKR